MGRISAVQLVVQRLTEADEDAGRQVEQLCCAVRRANRESVQARTLYQIEARKVQGVPEESLPEAYRLARQRSNEAAIKLAQCRGEHKEAVNRHIAIRTRLVAAEEAARDNNPGAELRA